MIFYRNFKNRYFKPKNSRSGQIFPVLLICIAGLLAALVITRNTGEANIAKTCASNAADAGSLSAASCLAGAFNRLVYRNWNDKSDERPLDPIGYWNNYMGYSPGALNSYYYYKEMKKYYVQMRASYEELYNLANDYLDEAADLLQQAIDKAESTYSSIEAGEPECSQIWEQQLVAKQLNLEVAELVFQAGLAVGAFNACTAYMGNGQDGGNAGPLKDGVASWFRKYQLNNLCDAFDFMAEQYKRAKQTGQFYALSNSCYSDKLTDSQRDNFNFWLGGGAGSSFNSTGGGTVSYTPPGGGCKIDATVEVPEISKYDILMADWNFPRRHTLSTIAINCCCLSYDCIVLGPNAFEKDPFNYKSSHRLTSDLVWDIKNYFVALANRSKTIYDLTVDAADCCSCSCPGHYACPPSGGCDSCGECCDRNLLGVCVEDEGAKCNWEALYKEAEKQRTCLLRNEQCIVAALRQIKSAANPAVSVANLKQWNEDIWKYLWPAEGSTYKKILYCADAKVFPGVAPDFPGMMVINIFDVKLANEDWKTYCKTVSSCGATSTSKSKFCGEGWPCGGKGELVGAFSPIYYPEITDAD